MDNCINKVLILCISFLYFVNMLSMDVWADNSMEVEKSVDFDIYLGKWFEVAKIPHSFQKQCAKNTMAEYSKAKEGSYIEVKNSCETKSGDASIAKGRAKVVDDRYPAKLRVTFVKFFSWIFTFGGDYWILKIGNDYQYAVIGHPSRKYAWILSRVPNMSLEQLVEASEVLKKQGYDLCRLEMSDHDGLVDFSEMRLCDKASLSN